MQLLSICDFRKNISEMVNKVAYSRTTIILTRRRRKMAVLISIDDYNYLIESAFRNKKENEDQSC